MTMSTPEQRLRDLRGSHRKSSVETGTRGSSLHLLPRSAKVMSRLPSRNSLRAQPGPAWLPSCIVHKAFWWLVEALPIAGRMRAWSASSSCSTQHAEEDSNSKYDLKRTWYRYICFPGFAAEWPFAKSKCFDLPLLRQEHFVQALDSFPSNSNALFLLGMAALEMGLLESAVELMNKSLLLDPDFRAPYVQLGKEVSTWELSRRHLGEPSLSQLQEPGRRLPAASRPER